MNNSSFRLRNEFECDGCRDEFKRFPAGHFEEALKLSEHTDGEEGDLRVIDSILLQHGIFASREVIADALQKAQANGGVGNFHHDLRRRLSPFKHS